MRYRIALFLQIFNEVESGHLKRFLKWNMSLVDYLCVFDDASNDGTYEELRGTADVMIQARHNSFGRELFNRQKLLEASRSAILDIDYFLWLDADEVMYWSRDELEHLIGEMRRGGHDALRVPLLNLWRSEYAVRTDSSYDLATHPRIWENRQELQFDTRPGLHNQLHPKGLRSIADTDFSIVHYGFVHDDLILDKFLMYQAHGQRGWPLNRLVDESRLALSHIHNYRQCLGSRFPIQSSSTSDNDLQEVTRKPSTEWYLEARRLTNVEKHRPDDLTLISLIYQSTEWLEFVYGELLGLQKSAGAINCKILLVANHASEEVLRFLKDNIIPHEVFCDNPDSTREWYVNHVYRAYNFGVACAETNMVLLVNSDMAFDKSFLPNLLQGHNSTSLSVGRLVEPGVLRTDEQVIERYFGLRPRRFFRKSFNEFAIRSTSTVTTDLVSGGLYMPLLVNREVFLRLGGFPGGNIRKIDLDHYLETGEVSSFALPKDSLVPGDAALFMRAKGFGIGHTTNTKALAYHFQAGERRWKAKSRTTSGVAIINEFVDGVNGERVFWRDLGSRLEKRGVRVEYIYTNRAVSPSRFSIIARRELRRMLIQPRVVIANSSFTYPLPRSFHKIVIRQDLPASKRLRFMQTIVRRTADLVVSNDANFVGEVTGEIREWMPLPLSDVWDVPAPTPRTTGFAVFVGAFNETKGWNEVKALVLSKTDTKWVLVSKHKDDEHGLSSDTGPNWTVMRQCSQDRLLDLFDNSMVFVLGSAYETQCLAALEAASRNVPVVMHETGLLGNLNTALRSQVGEFGSNLNDCFERAMDGIQQHRYRPRNVVESLDLIGETKYDQWVALVARELQNSFRENKRESRCLQVNVFARLSGHVWFLLKWLRRSSEYGKGVIRVISRGTHASLR